MLIAISHCTFGVYVLSINYFVRTRLRQGLLPLGTPSGGRGKPGPPMAGKPRLRREDEPPVPDDGGDEPLPS